MLSASYTCDARILFLQILKEYEFEINTFTGIKNTLESFNVLENNERKNLLLYCVPQ